MMRELQYRSNSDLHQATTRVGFKCYKELRLNTEDNEKINCWLQLVHALLISLFGCLLPPPLTALPGSWRPPLPVPPSEELDRQIFTSPRYRAVDRQICLSYSRRANLPSPLLSLYYGVCCICVKMSSNCAAL